MHPINNKYFGNAAGTSIKVHFSNGTATVTGWIVKQTGASRYVVTSNGVNSYAVTLAANTTLAQSLTSGYATINVTSPSSASENAWKVTEDIVYTTQGHMYPWVFSNASSSQGTLDHN